MAKVLVVDDDAGLRFTLGEVLGARDFTVVAVESGAQALERLSDADVVLTDLAMPELDGLQLLSKIRERAIPICRWCC